MNNLFLTSFYFVLIILLISGCGKDQWTKRDIQYEVAYGILHAIDYGQTKYISTHPEDYYELNPVLGKHPSPEIVDLYFPLSMAFHIWLTDLIPVEHRRKWQMFSIMVKGGLVYHNYSGGICIEF